MHQFDILERIRVLEADIEKRRDAVVEQQLLPIENPRHVLMRDRFVAQQTAGLSADATQLLDLYLDGDELPAVQEEQIPLDKLMSFFNARVANIREYYRTHSLADGDVEEEVIEPDVEELIENGVFHPSEKYGTRLVLDAHHSAFERFLVRCGMDSEVSTVAKKLRDTFAHIDAFIFNPTLSIETTPQRLKLVEGERYLAFITALRDYLVSFYSRVKPLQVAALAQQMKHVQVTFASYWKLVEDAFVANGGEEAAIAAAAQPQKRFQAAAIAPRTHPFLIFAWDLRLVPKASDRALARTMALVEAEIAMLAMRPNGLMHNIIHNSAKAHQADRTKLLEERRREEDAAEEAFLDSLEHAEERIRVMRSKTAPKVAGEDFDLDLLNLDGSGGGAAAASSSSALGMDMGKSGKATIISGDTSAAALADRVNVMASRAHVDEDGNALPSWQIKLEGRNKTFVCEVCAGAVYHGPKEWREHFRYARHTEGLRRLGIINTHDFDGISTIMGAHQMAEQLKSRHQSRLLKRIREEERWMEVEDEMGMVLRRGQYEDARQAMLAKR